ncbi:hypothetical protein AX15_005192 [Amanita polypyramis BW_CC]|nr:hypothetical protein AX15_005192 [Amanita polypyramis BW_CC]
MKLSFSLNVKPKVTGQPPSLKRPAAFGEGDEDEAIDAAPTSTNTDANVTANKKLLAQNVVVTKATKKRMEAEKKVDPSVYGYDEVWDKMQEVKLRQKEAKEQDAKERKPKYIQGLLSAAATRRLDHLRAEEKMMQHEREAEGDMYKDRDVFVTQAYKEQMEEVKMAEEEEKRREEQQKKKGGQSTGLAIFYRKMLEETEHDHEATVAATQKRVIGPQGPVPNLTITKPADYEPMSDVELANFAREQGREVELNDDNQIVDKRELLSAGLNLSLPNTRRLGLNASTGQSDTDAQDKSAQVHRAVGTAASRREINERRMREIQKQMKEEQDRLTQEKERAQDEAIQRVVARRNDESSVQSARERFLQRKRQRLIEQSTGD